MTVPTNGSSASRRSWLAPVRRAPSNVVQEVGVRVDVHDIELAQRLHPTAERIADRVVAADRDQQCATLDDPARGARDPPVICLRVRALDRDVTDVRHPHADQVVAIGLHVIPALRARIIPGTSRPRIVELRHGRLAGRRRPRPLPGRDTRLRCAAVVRDTEERHLRIEHLEVAHARHPEERPRRGIDQHRAVLHERSVAQGAAGLAGRWRPVLAFACEKSPRQRGSLPRGGAKITAAAAG